MPGSIVIQSGSIAIQTIHLLMNDVRKNPKEFFRRDSALFCRLQRTRRYEPPPLSSIMTRAIVLRRSFVASASIRTRHAPFFAETSQLFSERTVIVSKRPGHDSEFGKCAETWCVVAESSTFVSLGIYVWPFFRLF